MTALARGLADTLRRTSLHLVLVSTVPAIAAIAAAAPPATGRLTPVEYFRTLQSADSAARAHDDQRAAESYARLLRADSLSGRVWQGYAFSHYRLGRFDEASRAFQRAIRFGGASAGGSGQSTAAVNAYNVACCEARLGHRAAALDWLERSITMGFPNRNDIAGDEDLTSLHDNPRYEAIAHPPVPGGGTSREAGWRADLDFLVGEVRRLHAEYRREPLPETFNRAATLLRTDLPRLDDASILTRLQALIAQLGDGHSVLWPGSARVPMHSLPIQLYLFPEGTYVVRDGSSDATLVGRRVVSIGGRPISQLVSRAGEVVSRDNDMGVRWVTPRYLAFTEVLSALGAVADSTGTEIVTEDARGSRRTARVAPDGPTTPHIGKLPPAGRSDPPLYLRKVDDAYWTEWLENGRVLYLQFNQVMNKPDESLPAFGLRLREELARRSPTDVIVDVRHNNGGNGTLLTELLRTLVTFDATHPGRHLFVVTGRGTFSAAQVFINRIESMTNAVFAGEPSSSRPDFVGEDTPVTLPYSGLTVSVSSRRHFTDGADARTWIPVSIPAPLTAADYFAGRDRALEAVLEIIRDR